MDGTVQKWLISTHLVLELANLLDDFLCSRDLLLRDGRREIVRLGRYIVTQTI